MVSVRPRCELGLVEDSFLALSLFSAIKLDVAFLATTVTSKLFVNYIVGLY